MMKNRWIAACLCTLLLIPATASCADASGTQTDTTPIDTANVTDAAQETLDPTQAALDAAVAKMEGKDFGGHEFRIMDRSEEQDPNWETIDVWAEAESGDTINDAV
ncbi:MAG: hypothetical protein IJ334_11855, partial [Clostridia bacterium]|nr:hypothetical protein [Clostridia bacterium]